MAARVAARLRAADDTRRGICLMNAGRFDEAIAVLARVLNQIGATPVLSSCLGALQAEQGELAAACDLFAQTSQTPEFTEASQIRESWATWNDARHAQAMEQLRAAILDDPNSAELHYQLGVMLAASDELEEAELRFTQAISIDRNHSEALVQIALCLGARHALTDAVRHLQRAQNARPHDPRIAFLMAQAAKALHEQGRIVQVRGTVASDSETGHDPIVAEMLQLVEADPDFIDALLALPTDLVDEGVFSTLLRTVQSAVTRKPGHADLHFQCGRVLARLGRNKDAISENEQAVALDPKCVRALIELGKLYRGAARHADATERLEQAVRAGAEYADVYYLLGSLYKDQGRVTKARSAFRHALTLNSRYEAAKTALAAMEA